MNHGQTNTKTLQNLTKLLGLFQNKSILQDAHYSGKKFQNLHQILNNAERPPATFWRKCGDCNPVHD